MPFAISQNGYGAGMAGGLGALIGNDFAKYKITNPWGLEDYTPEGFGTVNIDGSQYNVRYDNTTGKYLLHNPADPSVGSYVYGADGKLENWTPHRNESSWPMAAQFVGSALSVGLGGALMGAGSAAADGAGAVSGMDLAADTAGFGGAWAPSAAGTMGAGAGLAEASPTFNAAADSQLANVAIDSAGGNALSAYTVEGLSPAVASAAVDAPWYEKLYQSGVDKFSSLGPSDLASAAVKYGAPIVGGLISSNGAAKAADTQAAATDRANAMLQGQYDTTRNDLAPWRDSGVKANNALVSAMGLGPNDGSAGYGSLTKKFTGADLPNDPGYQFELNQGQRQIDQRAASGGSYFSGNALKAAAKYGTDYAGTKFGEAFNRDAATKGQQYGFLSGMSTQGQNAANMTGQFGATTTGQIAGNTTAQGNASGAAQIMQGNALQNAIGGVTNTYNQDNMLQQMLASQERQRMITGGNTNGLR
jgi:hypothetical protein